MTRIRAWLHGSVWRPLTLALILLGSTVGLALDYGTGQRGALCESNNRTVAIVQQLVHVTFDNPATDPGADPLAVLNALPEYQRLSPSDQTGVLNTLSVLAALSTAGNTSGTQQRLEAFAAKLSPAHCTGGVIFGRVG